MAMIVLKAWYLETVLTLGQIVHPQTQPRPDLRLSQTGLLKSGMRADFLDDVEQVQGSAWLERYLRGDVVEFYVEGSGVYSISNVNVVSRELYLTKRSTYQPLLPTCFWIAQQEDATLNQRHSQWLEASLAVINADYQPVIPLTLTTSPEGQTVRVDAALLRHIRESVLVIADVSGVIPGSLPSPRVCLTLGFALQHKRPEQILLLASGGASGGALGDGVLPFDLVGCAYVHTQPALLDALLGQLHRLAVLPRPGAA